MVTQAVHIAGVKKPGLQDFELPGIRASLALAGKKGIRRSKRNTKALI